MVAPVRTRQEFDALSRSRARGRSGPIRVTRAPLLDSSGDRVPGEPHVAYAVSTRVGSAVVRNRVRRRLRAVMSSLDPDDGLTPGLYLVATRPEVVDLPWDELRHHVSTALRATVPARTRA